MARQGQLHLVGGDAMPVVLHADTALPVTGVSEIGPSETQKLDPQSVASVRVVQVTGAGDDVSQWTTEVAGTAKTLVAEKQGEGAVKWKHVQQGVWKADLVITTGGVEAYRETRILDLRKYVGQGMLFFLK